MEIIIYACALVLCAVAGVGLSLTISSHRHLQRELASLRSTSDKHSLSLAVVHKRLEQTTPEALKTAQDDLAASVAAHRQSIRRELGRIWQRFDKTLELEPPRMEPTAPVCENWQAALDQGPRSKAATCECAYCTEMRAQRAAEKAAILALHHKGAPRRANGSE